MSNPWFRLYSEAVDDEKLRLLAFEDRWHFIALLCCKNNGILDTEPGLMRRKVAVKLGLDLRELGEVARRLAEVGLIDEESMQPIKWNDRQFKSDTSAERTKAYRDRMKRHGDVTVTAQETESDTEQKQIKTKTKRTSGADVFPEVEDRKLVADWLKVRKEKRLALTDTALEGFMREVRKSGLSLETILKKCCEKGWGGFEAKWLESDYNQPKRAEKFDALAFVNKYSTQARDEKLIEH
jgi:hypothetical protein